MKLTWDGTVTITLAVCALVTTGLVVHHETEAIWTDPRSNAAAAAKYIRDWKSYLVQGNQVEPAAVPVQLIEFADFECPFCGGFYKVVKATESKYPHRIALTFVHFPIQGHRFATAAARVAECARDQGRFESMYDQLFQWQDQFGLKSWDEYAAAAGIPDIAVFDACIKQTTPVRRVEEGKALGARLDVQGTPTVIINGWKLGHPPNEEELDQMVQRVLAGKPPVDGKS